MPGARGLHRNYESIIEVSPQARQQFPRPPPRSRHPQTEAKWTVNLLVNAGKLASWQAGNLVAALAGGVASVATVPLLRWLTLTILNSGVWHTLCYAPRIAC
jgi:hypothetical protein